MPLQKLDRKQVPQVAVLAVLSCGVLGYFAKQMVTPSPAAAAFPAGGVPLRGGGAISPAPSPRAGSTPPAPDNGGARVGTSSLAPPNLGAGGPPAPALLGDGGPLAPTSEADASDDAALPVDAGRDPFQQTVPSTAAPAPAPKPAALVRPLPAPKAASLAVPAAPPLPAYGAFGGLRSLPAPSVPGQPAAVAQAAPLWTVTGVLTSGAEHIVILRSGTERRFVRQGEWLDGQWQVARVSRDSVTLGHGSAFYSLPLGGSKAGIGQAVSAPQANPNSGEAGVIPAPAAPSLPPVAPAPQTPSDLPLPSAISLRPAAHRPTGRAVLASVPHTWAHSHPVRQATLINSLAAPRLSFAAPPPTLALPILRPVVKVAAFRARSVVKKHVVKSLVSRPAPQGMLALGSLAPEFDLPALDGSTVSLSQLRGHPVVLTFWASWVGACGPAVPALQRAATEGHAAFVGVGTWDSRPALLSFARTHSLNSRSVLCDDSVANLSIAVRLFKVPDVPACYVLDRDGHVVAAFMGFGPDTAEAVRALLLTLDAS